MKEDFLDYIEAKRKEVKEKEGRDPERIISQQYYQKAIQISAKCVNKTNKKKRPLTSKIDKIVLNRFTGPLVLLAIIYLLYNLSIVQGYKLTNYTWPILASFRDLVASILPSEGLLFDPLLRSLVLSVMDGILAVLNYVPIFAILFTLVAVLEDIGYIPRMTFIMDRVFRHFGLHGQSLFPLVLGGVFVGGCAIPGVMATRGIKDEKARLATILIVPLMNCLAKTPLYILLIGLFFKDYQGFTMFFMATITLIIALSVSKLFSLTILKRKEPAPFVLEMPPYHLPTITGVIRRCLERLWLFFKKIVTIVIVVMALVFALTHFPGLDQEQRANYQAQMEQVIDKFYQDIGQDSPYRTVLAGDNLEKYINYNADYSLSKRGVDSEEKKEIIDNEFKERNLAFYKIANRGVYREDGELTRDREAMQVAKAYRYLERGRKELRAEINDKTLINSVLGLLAHKIEPITKYAGFNWRVNMALISSFAAKESSVATLGSIYKSDQGESLEEKMSEQEQGWTPLHALAIMLFMAMYPPCIPTLMAVRLESGSTKWMLFAGFYPIILGSFISILIFSGGNLLGLSGLQAMISFYILAIITMVLMGFIKQDGVGNEFAGDIEQETVQL
ncbi:ferrous iron transport protein B [Iocasia frigidifontis]|uniref:Ferrous iron transport protein B n=1 Tax=Iocasia fonsfrigidae TaxID=2682810 RepID=A0A8A7KM21_9FIRM|nr:nucleoside recognition domain-containing protein [Iocasia fonsfrigidae]QTL98882.1 ferrous iron transport protein B [Iocasia fonsfrigidae]